MPEQPLPDSTVVVTGGAGFVGSHLTDRLLEVGARVIVLDDLSNGDPENLPTDHRRLRFERLCIGRSTMGPVRTAVELADLVIHLASPVGVGRAHRDPRGTARRMLDSGRTVIDACRATGTPILLTSSSEVYGSGGEHPLPETALPVLGTEPRWRYAAAKLTLERLITALHEEHVNGWIVRLFNIVGARQRATTGHVLPSFCVAAARGEPLPIHGDGTSGRTFLHVADAVDGLVAVLSTPVLAGASVNIGGDTRLTISELADLVIDRSRSKGSKEFVPEADVFGPDFAPVHDRVPDTTRLRRATTWVPRRTVTDAVDDRLREAIAASRIALR